MGSSVISDCCVSPPVVSMGTKVPIFIPATDNFGSSLVSGLVRVLRIPWPWNLVDSMERSHVPALLIRSGSCLEFYLSIAPTNVHVLCSLFREQNETKVYYTSGIARTL